MNKGLIENEYSIQLEASSSIQSPYFKTNFLAIILFFDEITSIASFSKIHEKKVCSIKDIPMDLLVYTRDIKKFEEQCINYCNINDIIFIKNVIASERDEYIYIMEKEIPGSAKLLKKSFLMLDILDFILKNYLCNTENRLNDLILNDLANFKKSNLCKSFQKGILLILEKYHSNYYLTESIKKDLNDSILSQQNELLNRTNLSKLKTFDFSAIIEDGAGIASTILLPIMPIGTLKEIYNYFKNKKDFKNNDFYLFILSLFYIQKVMNKFSSKNNDDINCPICKLTVAEIDKLSEEECHKILLEPNHGFCINHIISYLNNRKIKRLVGKKLLIFMKENG